MTSDLDNETEEIRNIEVDLMTEKKKKDVKPKAPKFREQRDVIAEKIVDYAKTQTKDAKLLGVSMGRAYWLVSQEAKK